MPLSVAPDAAVAQARARADRGNAAAIVVLTQVKALPVI